MVREDEVMFIDAPGPNSAHGAEQVDRRSPKVRSGPPGGRRRRCGRGIGHCGDPSSPYNRKAWPE